MAINTYFLTLGVWGWRERHCDEQRDAPLLRSPRTGTLLGMWVDQHDLGRRDSIERWLFEEGKRVRRSGSRGAR